MPSGVSNNLDPHQLPNHYVESPHRRLEDHGYTVWNNTSHRFDFSPCGVDHPVVPSTNGIDSRYGELFV